MNTTTHPAGCRCRGCWIDCKGCFPYDPNKANPYAPEVRHCPEGHPETSPDPECAMCQAAARNPALRKSWAGMPAEDWERYRARLSSNVFKNPFVCKDDCPGTELKLLLASMGITPGGCNCEKRSDLMDAWGWEKCEKNKDQIVAWLRAEGRKMGWRKTILTAVANLRTGIRLRFSPFDPAPGLVAEAIRRARGRSGGLRAGQPVPPWEEGAIVDPEPSGEAGGVDSPQEEDAEAMAKIMSWAYGVMTTPGRRSSLLPRTLASLARGGFTHPRLFVDGADGNTVASYEEEFGLEVTGHHPALMVHGNWFTALHELFIRDPHADRFAIFQDDLITYPNLKVYLSSAKFPPMGYLNLLTFPENQRLAPPGGVVGFYPAGTRMRGLGAVALVFDQAGVLALLTSPHMVGRPLTAVRGEEAVDGGIVDSMNKAGFREYVHHPSLVEHTGDDSTICHDIYPKSPSFQGEDFDAAALLLAKKL